MARAQSDKDDKASLRSGSEPELWSPHAPIINAAAYAFNTAVVGASAVGLLGLTQKGVTDAYPTLVTPQLLAFGIWNPIYMAEGLWVAWALLRKVQNEPLPHSVAAMGRWFAAANILQALWSVPWAREALGVSTALNWGATFALYAATVGLRKARRSSAGALPPAELWCAHLAIPLHAGWVLAATLVNANMALVGGGATIATQLYAAVATAFGLTAAGWWRGVTKKDIGYGAGVAWALLGIAANQGIRAERLSGGVARGLQLAVGAAGAALAVALAAGVKRGGSLKRALQVDGA